MNELTEGGSVSDAIARRYGVQGNRAGAISTLATDLFPTVAASDRHMDEDVYSLVGRRASSSHGINAVVGEFSAIRLINPPGSGIIAVVEAIHVNVKATAGVVELRVQQGATTITQAGRLMDTRLLAARAALGTAATTSAAPAGFGSVVAQYGVTANVYADIDYPVVLNPNSVLTVVETVANEALNVTYRWRERRMGTWESGA